VDQTDHRLELERRIQQARRSIASKISEQTTAGRLTAWADELRQKLRQHMEARRTNYEIKVRAYDLWEQNGRPDGRDLEFWLQAESEILDRNQ
jgi:hypothetical protein